MQDKQDRERERERGSFGWQDIPSTGLDRWYKLEARTQRSTIQGRIRLKLWLSTREDRGTSEEDNWGELRQQERLYTVFLNHEMNKQGVRYSGNILCKRTRANKFLNEDQHEHKSIPPWIFRIFYAIIFVMIPPSLPFKQFFNFSTFFSNCKRELHENFNNFN